MAEPQKITTTLLFSGQAEEAIGFYTGLFDDSSVQAMQLYGAEFSGGPEGQVAYAAFTLAGQAFAAMDSGVEQPFTFTPAISLTVACADEPEIDRLAAALSEGGAFLMPLESYPFARKYAWVQDRFGVSWQLSLA